MWWWRWRNVPPANDPNQIVTGTVELPAGDADSLNIMAGLNELTPISDGSFSTLLRDDAPALIAAVDSDENPVLMAVSPTPGDRSLTRAGTMVALNARTTAQAMIYLLPLVAQNSPEDERGMLGLIDGLPETAVLEAAIEAALRSNPASSPLDNPAVADALGRAYEATVAAAVARIGNRTIIDPALASEIEVTENTGQTGANRIFTVKNMGKRWLRAEMSSTGTGTYIPSISPVISFHPMGPQSAQFTANITDGIPDVISVYGLGFKDGPPPLDSTSLWVGPAAMSLVCDIAAPILSTVTNANLSSATLVAIAEGVRLQSGFLRCTTQLANGYYPEAFQTFMKTVVETIVAEDMKILKRIALEAAKSLPKMVASYVWIGVKIVQLVAASIDLGRALASIAADRWREVFTITATGDAEVEIRGFAADRLSGWRLP